ncbi:MAG TPA: SRPBCC domain-containing protein [Polyangiaceae bacterium]
MNNSISLIVQRTIRAPVERVFEAWTRPEQLLLWWGPRPVKCTEASVDLRAGGSYRLGNLLPDGRVLFIFGEFELVEPPTRLTYSWHVEDPAGVVSEASRVSVRFEPVPSGTNVVVVHERIDTEATRSDHEQGWQGCLDNLAAQFAHGSQAS